MRFWQVISFTTEKLWRHGFVITRIAFGCFYRKENMYITASSLMESRFGNGHIWFLKKQESFMLITSYCRLWASGLLYISPQTLAKTKSLVHRKTPLFLFRAFEIILFFNIWSLRVWKCPLKKMKRKGYASVLGSIKPLSSRYFKCQYLVTFSFLSF